MNQILNPEIERTLQSCKTLLDAQDAMLILKFVYTLGYSNGALDSHDRQKVDLKAAAQYLSSVA